MQNASPVHSPPRLHLRWLIQVRWVVGLVQILLLLLADWWNSSQLAWLPLVCIAGTTLGSNLALTVYAKRTRIVTQGLIAFTLGADVVLITALLFQSGGAQNPFSVLYIVPIALGAITLSPRWTFALLGMSVVGFGLLFLQGDAPMGGAHDHHHEGHLRGMWLAYVLVAAFTVYFLNRVTTELRKTESVLATATSRSLKAENLAAIATMAAGAAHELATPLNTIYIAAKELEHSLPDGSAAVLREDTALIRSEVERCRNVLSNLGGGASHRGADEMVVLRGAELLDLAMVGVELSNVTKEISAEAEVAQVRVPPGSVGQVIRGIIQNAKDAAADTNELHPVRLVVDLDASGANLEFAVHDHASGMSEETLLRATDPFFSTKEAGKGMGLGLFLAREVASQLGGDLKIESKTGTGTSVRLSLPVWAAP